MSEDFLTTQQLAKRWNLVPATLKQWRSTGKSPLYHKIGGRINYNLEDIQEFEKLKLRSHTSMPEPSPLKLSTIAYAPKEIRLPQRRNSKRNRRHK